MLKIKKAFKIKNYFNTDPDFQHIIFMFVTHKKNEEDIRLYLTKKYLDLKLNCMEVDNFIAGLQGFKNEVYYLSGGKEVSKFSLAGIELLNLIHNEQWHKLTSY